jgi:uncharacterized protein
MIHDRADNAALRDAERRTVAWLERVVIGLNLCPFAKAVHVRGRIRFSMSDAQDEETLLADLEAELGLLAASDEAAIETTLLMVPGVLGDFRDYNDFLDRADAALERLGLADDIQVASFHPDYRFADADDDDPANCTNRSPLPLLHLLRQSSVDRAVAAFPDAADIYERNIATLRALGVAGWQRTCDGEA